MKRPTFLALALFTAFSSLPCTSLCAEEDEPRTAEEILRLVRLSYALQDYKLRGQLRDDSTGRLEPMELTMSKQVIRFRFINPPAVIVHLDLTTEPATLWQVKAGGSAPVPLKDSGRPVRGMDFNYEDLSMRFLYWRNPKLLGEERVSTVKCWKIRVTAPDRNGPYGTVDLWVHKESGGIAKMEAWNVIGKMVKRFQVTKVQKVDKATVLKEMRVESFNPLNGDRKGRTYMTLDNPEKNK
ncbi:MAG: outer membrane lipoprotein-sorting protein [Prosthecobacter sp.]|nr:outer membrane lipoprotein-sorting protein [Prosthecobacter sp.]